MKAGLKALQNTSFPTFHGLEDANVSPGMGLSAKQKKLLAKAGKMDREQLDAVQAQNPSTTRRKGCFDMRDHGSCKHGDK